MRPLSVSSTAVHLLHLDGAAGGHRALVLRRFVDRERLEHDPWYVPRHEVAALRAVEPAPVRTPRLIAADDAARECDVPTLLTTYLVGRRGDGPGRPPTTVMVDRLAGVLPDIHAVAGDATGRLPGYAPYTPVEDVRVPDWSRHRDVWRRVLELLAAGPPEVRSDRLIHRDYHPGNTMWLDGELTGVVDWTTACVGPPAVDLARMRQNLVLLDDVAAADRFLERYVAVTGRDHDRHPWWDLRDAADMLADVPAPAGDEEARRLGRWERYVAGVAAEL